MLSSQHWKLGEYQRGLVWGSPEVRGYSFDDHTLKEFQLDSAKSRVSFWSHKTAQFQGKIITMQVQSMSYWLVVCPTLRPETDPTWPWISEILNSDSISTFAYYSTISRPRTAVSSSSIMSQYDVFESVAQMEPCDKSCNVFLIELRHPRFYELLKFNIFFSRW